MDNRIERDRWQVEQISAEAAAIADAYADPDAEPEAWAAHHCQVANQMLQAKFERYDRIWRRWRDWVQRRLEAAGEGGPYDDPCMAPLERFGSDYEDYIREEAAGVPGRPWSAMTPRQLAEGLSIDLDALARLVGIERGVLESDGPQAEAALRSTVQMLTLLTLLTGECRHRGRAVRAFRELKLDGITPEEAVRTGQTDLIVLVLASRLNGVYA